MGWKNKEQSAVLITGAGKRIGQAVALHLAECGFAIALHYHRSKTEATKTHQLIREKGGVCEVFAADLTRDQDIKRLINKSLRTFPALGVLINNASIFTKGSLKDSPISLLDEHYRVNLRAPYALTQEFSRQVKSGSVINILDRDIVKNKTSHTAYLLSKKSLADLTKLTALELAPKFRVNAVAPGAILPPEGKSNQYLKNLSLRTPLGKTVEPRDISRAIEFLLTNQNITGQIIFVDGGEHLT